MKKFVSAVLSASILFASAVPLVFAEGNNNIVTAPTGLVVNELTNPMNSEDVTFGWLVNGSGYNEVQTAYQIVVTDAVDNTEVWDSGKITSSEQSNIKCEGNLDEGHPYKWQVKTWINDVESDFSAESEFATGISDENWNAEWISDGTGGADAAVGSLNHFWYVRGEGSLDNTKEIAKAVGYFAGAQDYDLYINGTEIGRGQTFDYASESRYQGWDITDAVKQNTSNLTAGALVRTYGSGQGRAAVDAGFIGHINVYYTDGTSTIITTNSDWKVRTANAYSGTQYRDLGISDSKWSEGDFVENYDAQKAIDFTAADYDASEWTTATVLDTHNFVLYPELSKPTATLVKPVSITKLLDGTTVADFGEVIPARPSVTFNNGTAGTTVTIQGGYTLKSDGSVNTDQSQTQKTRMTWNYTQKDGAQTYDAWDHLGFRYLSIPSCGEDFTVDTIAAKVVHTNVPDGRDSTFVTSNETLNSVYELMKRSAIYSIQNSFVDTPTREKGQFLQDSINISEASMATSYERAASKKAIEQFMASADRYWTGDEAGRLNSVYPNGDGKRDIPDFTINFPYWVWNYYMQTGDKEFLEKAYPYVKNTADYITKYINSSTGLVTKLAGGDGNANTYMYGIVDWPNAGRFSYDWSGTKEGARTTVNMLSKRAFDVTALMAKELENVADQAAYEQKSEDLKTAINEKLINSNGLYCDGLNSSGNQVSHVSQHANSYALAFDVAPTDKSEKVSEYIASQGMKQGPMTADILVKGLINSGENAAALKLLTNTEDYGWAKEVANGYTFTFESWQADTDSNSQSHGWGATAASDILEGFAGVTVTEPGASKVRIAPVYVDLTSLEASVQTERGAVRVAYERSEADYNITITVPTNMTADIELPNIGDGKYVEKNSKATSTDGTSFSVGSGTYEFSYDGDITVLPEALDTTETETQEYDLTALSSSEYNAAYTGEYTSEDGLLTLKFGTSTSISEGGNGFDMYNDGAYVKFMPDKTGKISLDVKMRKSSGSNTASTLYMSTMSPNSGGTALHNTVSADTDITITDIEVESGTTYYLYNTAGRPTSIKKISYSYPKTYEITVAPEKTTDSIHWTFSAEKDTAESPYDYSDEYADIRVVLNGSAGDTVNSNGINFAGTGFADSDKSAYDTIGENDRYILFMPKYSGTLDISAVFDGSDFSSKCRVYALPLNASSVEAVDTETLGAIFKGDSSTQTIAAETSNSAAAVTKNIAIDANQVYALVTYSYKNYGSTISSFGYNSDFAEIDVDTEYKIETVSAEGGRVTFDKEKAKAGETVTATITAESGYELGKLDIDGKTVLATGDGNSVTFKMPAKNIDSNSVTAYFDETTDWIHITNDIHNFDGGITGTSSPKSKNLFDGIVNTDSVENYGELSWETEDDLILDAGEGNRFNLAKVIAYAKYGENDKAYFRIHASDSLETISNSDTIVLEAKTGSAGDTSVMRQELTPSSEVKARYLRIKYNKPSVKLSEIKLYGALEETPPSMSFSYNYSDGLKLYEGRRNKLEGSCYKIGNAEFKLIDENNNTVQTKAADLTGKSDWSIILDAVENTSGKYTLVAASEGTEYARISDITFEDMPIVEIGQCEYDGETVTVPVTVPAEDASEHISVYVAEYGEGGEIIGLAKTDTENVSEDMEISVDYVRKDETSEMKLFAWDEDMKPYSEAQYVYENISGKLSVAPASATYDSVALTWDKNSGDSYTYEIYKDNSKIDETTNLYYVAEGLEADTEYSFEVKVKNGDSLGTLKTRTSKKGAVINITDAPYNAKSDGTVNTAAIQKAIDDCPVNGTVLIPSGTFMTGALDLKSDMTLYLEEGAVLKGTANAADYKDKDGNLILSRFEGWELLCHRALITVGNIDHDAGFTTRNVYIRGKGTISGGGLELAKVTGGVDNKTDAQKESTRKRGRLISVNNAQNVNISGITITEPSSWTVHMVYSDRISTYGVTINTSGIRNGDGWNPDSSTNCMIFGSKFATGDDCIAIKSGKNPEGNIINRPTKHIRILNCEVMQPEGKTYSGLGLAIGSEMSGGVEDVSIVETNITNTQYGIEIKTPKARGGYVRNISVKDCEVDRIFIHNSDITYNDDGAAALTTPILSDFTFEGIKANGYDAYNNKSTNAIYIEGFDKTEDYARNITFKNVMVGGGITIKYCDGVTFDNVKTADGDEPSYSITDSVNITNS